MRYCFYCKKELYTITDQFLGDALCPHCKVMNSYYGNEKEELPGKEAEDAGEDQLAKP